MEDDRQMQEKEMRIRELVAEYFIKGYPKTKIAVRVSEMMGEKISLWKVNRQLSLVFETWAKKGITDTVLMRAVELQKIDARESELWSAWEESKQTGEGDARYMAELRRCSELRAKLLGIGNTSSRKGNGSEEKSSIVWNEQRNYGNTKRDGE